MNRPTAEARLEGILSDAYNQGYERALWETGSRGDGDERTFRDWIESDDPLDCFMTEIWGERPKPDPRNNVDDAYAAFMAMEASEWQGVIRTLLQGAGGGFTMAEQVGLERALADRPRANG